MWLSVLSVLSYVPSVWGIMDGVNHGYPRVVGRAGNGKYCVIEGIDFGPTVTVALIAVAMTAILASLGRASADPKGMLTRGEDMKSRM
jgi:hypothetical protein